MDLLPIEQIQKRIYFVRGLKVMLESDLAELYEIDVKQLKRQVRRNRERFPGDFMVELTLAEAKVLRCQIGTLKRGRHSKYLPFAFTEHGVAMLSSVLNNHRAIQVNIAIMRAFGQLREILATHRDLARKLEELERNYDSQFKVIFDAIRELMKPDRAKKTVRVKGFLKE